MSGKFSFDQPGFCDICEARVVFHSDFSWLRDHLHCPSCQSVPRERALMRVIDLYMPDYLKKVIHESSPGGRGISIKFGHNCPNYSYSHFFPDIPLGSVHRERGERCESLETLTFEDNSIDLFITQDVMEHVFDPAAAFREIARVLKPGGMHILTVPLVNKCNPTERRAERYADGTINHVAEPSYHGNPIDNKGSLVTMDWGYDILNFIRETSGLSAHMITIDEIERGIRAEFIEVLVCLKT
ncbi:MULTISPECIES: class I SAM-dependent methyltransferase [Hyphomonas]|uniref:Class I SAM-dependent methyltransferase n=1 Tax=Hyphomonas adhaerens TaxID=81029 RepID=A0A3B9GZW8_9PROT|nr:MULTISPECIES: class I SAM-dependent methyltransferase [Hyphomonas]MBB42117.1 SAM-dependent methyltransferase [Hyphomonas sp.]HAE27991.1 class I SAM-dependent methyltransferase [Hyphomonas adhaerens]HAF68270.1 class I SAM-dependent methyltransferase [Acidimicrobiaceae bacterium]|tara:strand:+ start:10450 stop:11175 length:726 start_codon:yes stop_codon:yes gene_type:complete